MSSPKVTVLTAVRNGAKYLSETIASIQAQTFTDWEYIIIDDASDDETVKVVEDAMRFDRRLRLIRREHSGGPFIAANDGLREARGFYIVRTDADDLSPANRIERQLAFLDSSQQFRSCISRWRSFDDRGVIPGSTNSIPARVKVLRWYLLLRSFACHSSLCIERSALLELGGYRELSVGADFRLLCELSRLNWVAAAPEVLSYVRRHGNRISTSMGGLQTDTAVDTMREHLLSVAGVQWSTADLKALWLAGHGVPSSLSKGQEAIHKWDLLWKSDPTLSKDDLNELAKLSAYHKWQLLHVHLRRQPGRCVLASVNWILRNPRSLSPGFSYLKRLLQSKRLLTEALPEAGG